MVLYVMQLGHLRFVIVLVLLSVCVDGELYLELSNSGPAVLESKITFTTHLIGYSETAKLYYIFDDGRERTQVDDGGTNVSFTRQFSTDSYTDGWYNMTVTVEKEILIVREKIITNYTTFQLGVNLFGHIAVLRNGTFADYAQEVGTGENLTFRAEIFDSNDYLKDAQIQYMWSIDMERHQLNDANFNYTYTDPGMSTIVVAVFASMPSGAVLFGRFTKDLDVKVPVSDVVVVGNPFIRHDKVLDLNVTCNGTPPFEYCWDIMNSNETVENNFTCTVIVSTTCSFEITQYFQKVGNYQVVIHVSNDVKVVKKNMEVVVYNVPSKPQLSTVIIPIVCTLLTLVIIAIGITYYRQQRKQLIVEVASFDFHDNSESYIEQTFFEQLWDSFRCRKCCSATEPVNNDILPSETQPLLI